MIFLPIIVLAIIQGITEFLPISSSGHLVLGHTIFDGALSLNNLDKKRLDIAVHIGTLIAVIFYFKHDFITLVKGGIDILRCKFKTPNATIALHVLIASIPVIACGLAMFIVDVTIFDSLILICWATLIFGIILYIADKRPQSKDSIENITIKHALIYGFFQCIALIPGVSRSGITMTAGRFMGYSRAQSARFSLLMGIVTITSAGLLVGTSTFQDGNLTGEFLMILGVGIVTSFITAYIAITVMMKWFAREGTMTPFVIYRILLGGGLLLYIYWPVLL